MCVCVSEGECVCVCVRERETRLLLFQLNHRVGNNKITHDYHKDSSVVISGADKPGNKNFLNYWRCTVSAVCS